MTVKWAKNRDILMPVPPSSVNNRGQLLQAYCRSFVGHVEDFCDILRQLLGKTIVHRACPADDAARLLTVEPEEFAEYFTKRGTRYEDTGREKIGLGEGLI